jgi:hypothetical protein
MVVWIPDDLSVRPYRCRPHERPGGSRQTSLVAHSLHAATLDSPIYICVFAHVSGQETRVHARHWHSGHSVRRRVSRASSIRMEIWSLIQKMDAAGFCGTSVPTYQTARRVTFKKTRGFYVHENVESRYCMPYAVARRRLPVAVVTAWAIGLRLIWPRKAQKACVTSDEYFYENLNLRSQIGSAVHLVQHD